MTTTAALRYNRGRKKEDSMEINDKAPDFSSVDQDGNKLALKDYVDTRPSGAPPLTWKETFALLGNPQLEQAVKTRGQGERRQDKALVETDWQAAVLSSEAVRSCDQLRRP